MAKKNADPVTALSLWAVVLESLGKPADEAERILADLAERFPDLDAFHRAVQSYIATELSPALAALPGTLLRQAVAWKEAGGRSVVKRTDSALG